MCGPNTQASHPLLILSEGRSGQPHLREGKGGEASHQGPTLQGEPLSHLPDRFPSHMPPQPGPTLAPTPWTLTH